MSVVAFPLDRIVRMPSEIDETTDLYWHEREQFPDRPEAELWADIRDLERSYGDLIRRQHPRYVGVLHNCGLETSALSASPYARAKLRPEIA